MINQEVDLNQKQNKKNKEEEKENILYWLVILIIILPMELIMKFKLILNKNFNMIKII